MESDSKLIFATNLKRLMEQKGVSASMVCADLNIPNTTFSDWCNGKSYPRIKKIEKLAEYFNVPRYKLTEKQDTKQSSLDVRKLFAGVGSMSFDEYFNEIFSAEDDEKHAFLALFSDDAELLSLREITPRSMGKKWSKHDIENWDIAAKIQPHVHFDSTEKTEFQLLKEYVEYLTEDELIALNKYIEYVLVASKIKM